MIAKKLVTNANAKDTIKAGDKKKPAQKFYLTELVKTGNSIVVPPGLTNLLCGGQWHLTVPLAGGSPSCELHLPNGNIVQHSVVLELLSVQRDLSKLVKKEENSDEMIKIVQVIAAHGGGVGAALDKVKTAIDSIKNRNANVDSFSAALRGMTEYNTGQFDVPTQVLLQFYADQISLISQKIDTYFADLCTKPRVAKLVDWFTEDGTVTHWFVSRIWREGQLSSMNGFSNIFQAMCAGRALTFTAAEWAVYGDRFVGANFSKIVDVSTIWRHFTTDEEKADFLKIPNMTEEIFQKSIDLLPVIIMNGDHIADYMPTKGTTLAKAYSVVIPKIPGGERVSAFVNDICGRAIIGKSTRNDTVDVARLRALYTTVPPMRKIDVLDHFNDFHTANVKVYKEVFLAPDLFDGNVDDVSKHQADYLLAASTPNVANAQRIELLVGTKAHFAAEIKKFRDYDRDKKLAIDKDGVILKPILGAPNNPKHYAADHERVKQIMEAKKHVAVATTAQKKTSKAKIQETKLLPVIASELREIYNIKPEGLSQKIVDIIGKLKNVHLQREAIRILHGVRTGEILEEKVFSGSEASSDEEA